MKIFELLEDRKDIIQSPEFKRWFGDSKVVDKNGRPLVVYHGTNADISTFDLARLGSTSGNSGYFGAGFYFSKFANVASNYAGRRADNDASRPWVDAPGGNVMPVYLSLQNPLNISNDKQGRLPANVLIAINRALRAAGGLPEGITADYVMEEFGERAEAARESGSDFGQAITRSLQGQGFDGVIFYDGEEITAFRPEQIKSAIGNVGKFDPNNPDITKEELI